MRRNRGGMYFWGEEISVAWQRKSRVKSGPEKNENINYNNIKHVFFHVLTLTESLQNILYIQYLI